MTYRIEVVMPWEGDKPALCALLQRVFDVNGVAGRFLVRAADGEGATVTFEREERDDALYVHRRLPIGKRVTVSELEKVACEQLLAEMTEYDPPPELDALIAALREGRYVCEGVAVLMPQHAVYYVWHDGGGSDNRADSILEARMVAAELDGEGHENVYITDAEQRVIDSGCVEMPCADEAFLIRPFASLGESASGKPDFVCLHCGWMQASGEGGAAEACASNLWHDEHEYQRYAAFARTGGYVLPERPPRMG